MGTQNEMGNDPADKADHALDEGLISKAGVFEIHRFHDVMEQHKRRYAKEAQQGRRQQAQGGRNFTITKAGKLDIKKHRIRFCLTHGA